MNEKEKIQKKLTYYQICSLVSQGRFDEIPEGYTIKWINCPPHKVINTEISGNSMKFTNNDFAIPEKIKLRGEYKVQVPQSSWDLFERSELLEFGDVFVHTNFTLTELKFIYENEESVERLKPYISRHIGLICGREALQKKDVVFSIELSMQDFTIEVINLFIKTFEGKNESNIVEFDYDYNILKK